MIEVRLHGRGGEGGVTFVNLLAKAAGYDDKYSQAFGAYGPERRGAPVKAFCRIDNEKITIRSQIYNPDYVVILDSSLLSLPDVSQGLKKDSVFIINSKNSIDTNENKAYFYDATSLALEVLGKPIVNTAMFGAFAKATELVTLESALKALEAVFPEKLAELNKKVVSRAYKEFEKKEESK